MKLLIPLAQKCLNMNTCIAQTTYRHYIPTGGRALRILFHGHPSPFNVHILSSVTSAFPQHRHNISRSSGALIKVTEQHSQILEELSTVHR